MKIFQALIVIVMVCLFFPVPGDAAEWYVSMNRGDNASPGTKAEPFKNIEKALKSSAAGDIIRVAEGNYFGLRGKGYLEAEVPVSIFGGYSDDFSVRNILKHQTMVSPDNASAAKGQKALLTFKKSSKGSLIVVDGIIFDMGSRNSYSDKEGKPDGCLTGMLLLPPQKNGGDNVTVTEQCIYFPAPASPGDVIIRNCVFLNSAKFAIQGGHRDGSFKILNNIFIANRMAAVEIFGTGGKKGPKGPLEKGGDVEIGHNTILFSWSRTKDLKDMGYGVRVMTNLSYDIHDNVIGMNVLTGIDHTRFNRNEWLKVDRNVFFLNKQGDMMFTEPGQGVLERVKVSDFGDLELAGAAGNSSKPGGSLPIEQSYLEGYLSVRYSEKADYDPGSPVNELRGILGLPKQGKLSSSVSMYMNRYPLGAALKLFGALKGKGAQLPDGKLL